MGKQALLHIYEGGNVNWYNFYVRQFSKSYQNFKHIAISLLEKYYKVIFPHKPHDRHVKSFTAATVKYR